jgi:hypothetical protein
VIKCLTCRLYGVIDIRFRGFRHPQKAFFRDRRNQLERAIG